VLDVFELCEHTPHFVTAVADYLRRAQHRPELRFEAPE
jgi:hypothetical protein